MSIYNRGWIYLIFIFLAILIVIITSGMYVYGIINPSLGLIAVATSLIWAGIMILLTLKAYLYELKHPVWSTVLKDDETSMYFISKLRERLVLKNIKYEFEAIPNVRRIRISEPKEVKIEVIRRIPIPIGTLRVWGLKVYTGPKILKTPKPRGLILRISPDRRKTPKEIKEILSRIFEELNMIREAKYWSKK